MKKDIKLYTEKTAPLYFKSIETKDKYAEVYGVKGIQILDTNGKEITNSSELNDIISNNVDNVIDKFSSIAKSNNEKIQNLITKLENGQTLKFEENNIYTLEATYSGITISDKHNIIIDLNNSIIRVISNDLTQYIVFNLVNCSNITIKNGIIFGDRLTHEYYASENNGKIITHYYDKDLFIDKEVDLNKCPEDEYTSCNCIRIANTDNVEISNVKFKQIVSDAIYLTNSSMNNAITCKYSNVEEAQNIYNFTYGTINKTTGEIIDYNDTAKNIGLVMKNYISIDILKEKIEFTRKYNNVKNEKVRWSIVYNRLPVKSSLDRNIQIYCYNENKTLIQKIYNIGLFDNTFIELDAFNENTKYIKIYMPLETTDTENKLISNGEVDFDLFYIYFGYDINSNINIHDCDFSYIRKNAISVCGSLINSTIQNCNFSYIGKTGLGENYKSVEVVNNQTVEKYNIGGCTNSYYIEYSNNRDINVFSNKILNNTTNDVTNSYIINTPVSFSF